MAQPKRLTWLSNGMPGTVLEVCDGWLLVQWAPGHKSAISGRTLWTPREYIDWGLVQEW